MYLFTPEKQKEHLIIFFYSNKTRITKSYKVLYLLPNNEPQSSINVLTPSAGYLEQITK